MRKKANDVYRFLLLQIIVLRQRSDSVFGYEGVGVVLLRLTLVFLVGLTIVRWMGNRAVGQFSPFDFVIMVCIGDIIASISVDRAESLLVAVEALVALLILQQLISYLALKNIFLRRLFEGTPLEFITDGKIIEENFKKAHFNYDDLRQELHKKSLDLTDIEDIKLARLESSGDFTVIKNPETVPLTKRDFNDYINSVWNNPLSPAGMKWAKLEQFMDDVHVLAEQARTGHNKQQ